MNSGFFAVLGPAVAEYRFIMPGNFVSSVLCATKPAKFTRQPAAQNLTHFRPHFTISLGGLLTGLGKTDFFLNLISNSSFLTPFLRASSRSSLQAPLPSQVTVQVQLAAASGD